jgi:hypothetical protein
LVARALGEDQSHNLDAVQAILDNLSANDKTAGGALAPAGTWARTCSAVNTGAMCA